MAGERHGMCESNMAALCKSNGKDNLKAKRNGVGTAWYVWISLNRFFCTIIISEMLLASSRKVTVIAARFWSKYHVWARAAVSQFMEMFWKVLTSAAVVAIPERQATSQLPSIDAQRHYLFYIAVAVNTGWSKRLCAPDDYSTKTGKNSLNSFNHLPW
jgi:hypothetical protein